MEIGPFIKLNRIEQGMTQEDLADGIVSMSYLSKIENQRTTASAEVMSLLCTRLGVELDNERNITINDKCKEWYKLLFEFNDHDKIVSAYNEIQELINQTHSNSSALFEIYKVRYFIVLGKIDLALEQINKLKEISSTFDNSHQFYWYKFRGNYNSMNGDFNQAMRMYKLAEEKIVNTDLDEEDKADLKYTIAVTHSKLRNTLEAIDYAEAALHTFMRKYNFIRCAECHIILGISYRRIRMYDKSIKNHNLAKHLGELNNNKQIIQLANQNLGYVHSTKGNKEGAIYNYNEVVKDPEVDLIARLAAATSLIKEYYMIDHFDKAREMIDKGFYLLADKKDNDLYKLYYYIIYTYHYALEADHAKFEFLVIDEFIPFLKKHKDYGNLVVYNSMLGNHYEKIKRYKNAAYYYQQTNLAYENLTTI